MDLDSIDRKILRILQEDARTPFSEVARQIDMSSATVHERVDKLESAGILEGYHAKVNPDAVGLETDAFVGVRVEHDYDGDIIPDLREIEMIREIHSVAGKLDMILRVRAENADELRDLLFDQLGEIDVFHRTNTMVVLGTEHEDDGVPL